jgi:hypothetical protein
MPLAVLPVRTFIGAGVVLVLQILIEGANLKPFAD